MIATLLAGLLQAGAAVAATPERALSLRGAELRQEKRFLKIIFRSGERIGPLERLARFPRNTRAGGPRFLCLTLRSSDRSTRLLCPGEHAAGGKVGLGVSRLFRNGWAVKRKSFRVEGKHGTKQLKLRVRLSSLGIRPGKVHWTARSRWGGEACPAGAGRAAAAASRRCQDRFPDRGRRSYKIVRLVAVGCTRPKQRDIRYGPRGKPGIALTFDDGPGPYTQQVLDVLDRYRAKSTFFVTGQEVAGDEGRLRKMVRGGHEVANHSLNHERYPSAASMRRTNELIEGATGFTPCLFRPPYGLQNSSTLSAARGEGMSSVRWDVDPQDWRQPGPNAIAARTLDAVNGSIVVMHDGGGNRSQTVAALPRIIKELRARGHRLVTVTKLLGGRLRLAEDR